MKNCPVCGSIKVAPNNLGGDTCLREGCGHTSSKRFRDLNQDTMQQVPGVAIGAGCYWIRPHTSAY
jgi:hypothetical protein